MPTAKKRKRDPDVIYTSDIPLTQQTFTTKRRSLRTPPIQSNASNLRLRKEQSTLTQPRFQITRTPSGSERRLDSDGEDELSTKRSRLSSAREKRKRKSDQNNTLTQMVAGGFGSGRKRPRLDEDGFEVWDGSEEQVEPDQDEDGFEAGDDSTTPRAPIGRAGAQLVDNEFSMLVWDGKSPRLGSLRSNDRADQEMPRSPRLEIKDSYSTGDAESPKARSPPPKPTFQTPKKARFTEIPSSQTPCDARLSTQRSRKTPVPQRSPLKDRSTNIISNKSSPSKIAGKSLELFTRGAMPTHEAALNDVQQAVPEMLEIPESSQQGSAEQAKSPSRGHRPQSNELDRIEEDSQTENAATASSPPHLPPRDDQSPVPDSPVRKLKRVNTVEDSQPDELDLAAIDTDATQSEAESEFQPNSREDEDWEDMGPNTYDPLAAALDRDAARYNQTETQIMRERVAETQNRSQYQAVAETQLEDQIDENAEDQQQTQVAPSSPELGEPAQSRATKGALEPQIDTDITAPESIIHVDSSDDLDTPITQSSPPPLEIELPTTAIKKPNPLPYTTEESQTKVAEPLSAGSSSQPSSPPIRPSQVSTVVPTQASLPQASHYKPPSASRQPSPQPFDAKNDSPVPINPTTPCIPPHQKTTYSQATTLLPTQPPLQPPQQTEYAPLKPAAPSQPTITTAKSLLPPQTQTQTQSTLSSSPLPLPPWSSPSRERYFAELERDSATRGTQGTSGNGVWKNGVYGELDDFSLPPPPPVSSWSGRNSEGIRSSPVEL
ncbi:hypothetical protein MBLNU230_g3685t1 [Neophaeotheca triangularis]